MKRLRRIIGLMLPLGLLGFIIYSSYPAGTQARSRYEYGSPSATGTPVATGLALSSKTFVLKHRRVVHVNIKNLAFGPQKIDISPGTKVTWTNRDGFQHTVTSDKGLWDSGPINSSSTFVRVFKKTGTFTYHCTIHPFMHGTITVKK